MRALGVLAQAQRRMLVFVVFGCGCGLAMFWMQAAVLDAQTTLPVAPEVRGTNGTITLTLRAVTGPDGRGAFSFNGHTIPPTIRVSPGDRLAITYVNAMSPTSVMSAMSATSPMSLEHCAAGRCGHMTNLHFHGLGVSPNAPQDDVLHMMAGPGQTLQYVVDIPLEQPPGLYWYHTHPHGESHQQALDGMSGAIVVEGIDRFVPETRAMVERVLVVRGRDIQQAADAASLRRQVGIPDGRCGSAPAALSERIMTVNGVVRPEIAIAPGERQFWRIINAGADTFTDLQLDGQPLDIVALDGIPRGYYDAPRSKWQADHRLIPPGGRLEVIVTGPPQGARTALRTRCVDTGPAGDPNPEMVLADVIPDVIPNVIPKVNPEVNPELNRVPVRPSRGAARSSSMPPRHPPIAALMRSAPHFVATFTEDEHGFYINGQAFSMDAKPMIQVTVGRYQRWRIVNDTDELHPMHLHQVHFLAYAQNGVPLENPVWVDTVNVPYRGNVDVIVDFTDPVIRGMSVFHCHLLNHEDKGMMAKVLFK